MDRDWLKRRCKAAETLSKHIQGIWNRLDEVPSFNGKAAFVDRIKNVMDEAGNLSWDLKRDLEELNETIPTPVQKLKAPG